MNFDYIPLDKAVIESYVKEFEQNRKTVLAKIRFDNGFEDSAVALNFMNELLNWSRANVNIHHLVYLTAYDYLNLDSMNDEQFNRVLRVINNWAHAFQCAYAHASSINFSWAFRELLKEVKPLIE